MDKELHRLFACEFGDIRLDWWQMDILENWYGGKNIALNKSRRIGFSYLVAVCAMLRAQTQNGYEHTFISLNHEEASNKISMCRDIYYRIPQRYRKRLKHDNVTSLTFLDDREGLSRSVIRSWPAKALRGLKGDVSFDEAAFIPKFDQVYDGTLPATFRPDSTPMVVTIGSTPFGNSGRFYEVITDRKSYPNYIRYRIPWFYSSILCKDVKAALESGIWDMDSEERVLRFGTEELIRGFYNYILVAWQQEMECLFVDSAASYITLEEIMANTPQGSDWLAPAWVPDSSTQEQRCSRELDEFILSLPEELIERGYHLYGGMDIGRTRNATEIFVGISRPDKDRKVNLVGMFTYHNLSFDGHRDALEKLFGQCPIDRFFLDSTGLGMDIGEWAIKKWGSGRVTDVQFTIHSKAELAAGLKLSIERVELSLPADRELQRQIHAIRRMASQVGEFRYDAKNEGESHADKFWALALLNLAVGFDEQRSNRNIQREMARIPRPEPRVVDPQQAALERIQELVERQRDSAGGIDMERMPPGLWRNPFR